MSIIITVTELLHCAGKPTVLRALAENHADIAKRWQSISVYSLTNFESDKFHFHKNRAQELYEEADRIEAQKVKDND